MPHQQEFVHLTFFTLIHPQATFEHLGLWPDIFDAEDPRPAREQVNDRYDYGGGWRPMRGFEMDMNTAGLSYPGDPELLPFARCELPLTQEVVWFYPHSQIAIVQMDGSFEVARMD